MTHRLVYVSRAGDSADLPAILAWSGAHNPTLGVTGALCLVDGVFMQCLEGELDVLQDLYRKIARDKRHRGEASEFGEGWPKVFSGVVARAFDMV